MSINPRKYLIGGIVLGIVGVLGISVVFAYVNVDNSQGAHLIALGVGLSLVGTAFCCCHRAVKLKYPPHQEVKAPPPKPLIEPIIEFEKEPGAGLKVNIIKPIEIEGKEEQEIEPGSQVMHAQSLQNIMKL